MASLPAGWTEHRAPSGQFYYFNSSTQQSTYVRPSSLPGQPPSEQQQPKKQKKEKPKLKEPIPGAQGWLKVTTTEGNVFWTHVESRRSEWTLPDEIRPAVEAWEREKAEEAEAKLKEEQRLAAEEEQRKLEEQQKARKKEEDRRAAAELEAAKLVEKPARGTKRSPPPPDVEPVAPQDGSTATATGDKPKKVKKQKVSALEDLDEDWQRQLAQEMAREAAEADGQVGAVPDAGGQGQLSSEEAKAMFNAMLLEKDIEPMAPWDSELPKFVGDPRYTAVKANKERRDLFDEFCKQKLRERRAAKQASKAVKQDPEQAYRSLLVDAVTSTRSHFEDFKLRHRKDARFRNFGRDDRDREREFKAWLKELGEKKRAEAKRLEVKFEELLAETVEQEAVERGVGWAEVRETIKGDRRFEDVKSSSLKEEIFDRWIKRRREALGDGPEGDEERRKEEKRQRQEASIRAREEQVRKQRDQLERDAVRSLRDLGREEAEREFRNLLVDAVRDHDVTWESVRGSLERDPRFSSASLGQPHRRDLFEDHLTALYNKRLLALESSFQTFRPSLADDSFPRREIVDDPAAKRLRVGEGRLEDLFRSWHRRRVEAAKGDFFEMLGQSSFIEFWGRMRKAALEKRDDRAAKKVFDEDEAGDEDGDGGEGGEDGGQVDLKQMAKNVDLAEVESVLRNDKRWIVFDHLPDQRERWMRDHLENLAAPKTTVYQKSS